jgi:hypothetical protein
MFSTLLAEDLAPLDRSGTGMARRAVRYVLAGEGAEVLEELASGPAARVFTTPPSGMGRGRPWLLHTDATPAQLVRLGRVYAATSVGIRLRLADAGVPPWVELLADAVGCAEPHAPAEPAGEPVEHATEPGAGWTWARWAEILAAGGTPADRLFRAYLLKPSGGAQAGPPLSRIAGVADAVRAHRAAVIDALGHTDAVVRAHAAAVLAPHVSPGQLLPQVVALAVDPAKGVREAGSAWLARAGPEAIPLLRARVEGDRAVATRALAITALWRMAPTPATRIFLAARREAERPGAARQAIEAAIGAVTAPVDEPPEPMVEPPPHTPASAEARRTIAAALADVDALAAPGPAGSPWGSKLDAVMHLVDVVPFDPAALTALHASGVVLGHPAFAALAAAPALTLAQLLRLCFIVGLAPPPPALVAPGSAPAPAAPALVWSARLAARWFAARNLPVDARMFAAELDRLGVGPPAVATQLLADTALGRGEWSPDTVASFFRAHTGLLVAALRSERGPLEGRASQALRVLPLLTPPPAAVLPVLWELALGASTADRGAAKHALSALPATPERVAASLGDVRGDARRIAAEWLAELKAPATVGALEAAVARERHEAPKAAMLTALEALGAPLDRFLDRKALKKEAERSLGRGVPEEIAWIPFDTLPRPRWAEDGAEVAPAVLHAWCVQAYRLKSPEPGPLLRRYAGFIRPEDAADFGAALLAAWIAEDVRPADPTSPGRDGPEPIGSAITTKGLFAVVAAMNPPGAAPLVQAYLRRWAGSRAPQCKALLQMLAWVDHPSAVQVILATALRFRTAGIRAEAEACVTALAARRGWSADELADRTVPTAGLDDDGRLDLDLGPLRVYARVGDDLVVRLESAGGQPLTGLPDARGIDSDALAAATKAVADLRRQLKSIAAAQTARLYEAMCAGRSWKADDWQVHLLRHPVVGRLARRLVWRIDGACGVRLVRAAADGALLDVEGRPVTPAEGDRLGIAHALGLDDAEVATCARLVAELGNAPLFPQIGRGPYRLDPVRARDTALDLHHGQRVDAAALRTRATRRGYTFVAEGEHAPAWTARFPTLGLNVVIGVLGPAGPGGDATLTTLRVFDADPAAGPAPLLLGDVPPVLLSEAWSDLAELAAIGPEREATRARVRADAS